MSSSKLYRMLTLAYGLISYIIGVAGLVCIILALAKLVPFGFMHAADSVTPVLWNLLLVFLWGLSHSVMARPSFKNWITKFIPRAVERSTYVFVAGIASLLLIGLWQTVPGVIWAITNPVAVTALWSLFAFGFAFLFASTFAINHFDLFGLRQVYGHFKGQTPTPLPFVKRAMYRTIRHPIQTGVLIGIWVTPEMTATQLVLSAGFTVYIFIGLWFEEKDLEEEHGEAYVQYKNETGKVLPRLKSFSRKLGREPNES